MQTTRETIRQKRSMKRRSSRKKSLSPSDLKSQGDMKGDSKFNSKRSLSEGSVKMRHKKGIQRTLTYPISCDDFEATLNVTKNMKDVSGPPESDESNIPPTSSDRDTEDDVKVIKTLPYRRWDSGSEMDSLVSIAVKKAARRRRTPSNLDWSANSEPGEVSEAEAGRMRPEDYRLVFLSSDSSCREDTEDSASTSSSAAQPAPDDCDWDYFEPGAPRPPTPPTSAQLRPPPVCPRACSCGAEPRIVAVPVPVPVPVPAALWPALLAFPSPPPAPHWNTYPGFPPLDAAALARLTTAAAVAVTAAATASILPQNKLEMTIDETDKSIRTESKVPDTDNDKDDKIIERSVEHESSDEIKVIAEDSVSVLSENMDAMPNHLDAENAFPSSNESADSSDSEAGVARLSYDFRSGAPEEPATTDEDSDDSGGVGGQFSRVFVVNPADSSSDLDDNADSSGIDCDDSFDKKSDSLEIIAAEIAVQNNINIEPESSQQIHKNNDNIIIMESVNFSENYPVISLCNNSADSCESVSKNTNIMTFCDENMLQSEICEKFNSFNTVNDDYENSLDYHSNTENNQSSGISENIECDSLDNSYSSDYNIKVSVSVDTECTYNTESSTSNEIHTVQLRKLSPSPEVKDNETSLQTISSATVEKIDLFKGIERTLSELLKKELMEDQGEEKINNSRPVCSVVGSPGSPVAASVGRPLSPDADARFTSRVMITHDRVSVVTSDTTRLMRDIIVHHTNSQNEPELTDNENNERLSDAESPQPSGGVTVVSNSDTLSAVVCLEEGLADDDSWVEDVSHDDDVTSPSDSDSGDEATLPTRADFAYCRRSLDFTLHTIVEESCEESETEQTIKKTRPISATELEKYFFFGLGDGSNVRDDEEEVSETSSICSEGCESIVEPEQQTNRKSGDSDELVSSRLEKYFLSGFMGFNQERHHSDGSGSVGSDSEGKQSPEQRRKRLVRARGAPRSHSSSLDNLLAGDEPSQDTQEISDGSSTETEDRHESLERLDMPGEMKRKKQSKKSRGSPADERRQSVEFPEETRDDTRSVSEGEDGRLSPRVEFPPLGSELSESKKQTSRDSGFVGSCDDLLKNGDNSTDFVRSHESKTELEEIIEEARPEVDERIDRPPSSRPPPSPLTRKDSFNNWSSDEETNLMMTKMRTFFKQMINTGNVRSSTPASSNSESSRPPKPPQLLYFESELTRLMKTVPGIRDEEVREIVEYLSSEDTWSDSYDSSDYAGSDLEGTSANRSALRKQISDSCREIIDEFDRGNSEAGSLERDAVGAYQRLAATLGRAGDGSPPLFGKVMRHIGGRLVALMHEVSAGAPPSTDEDSASEPGALARSRSHDILEATASRGSVASDCERFSWRGSFESALLAADSRGTLGGEARRSPAGAELAAQKSHSRSCGAISGSEDRLWRGRRRASAPDAESEEEQRAGSLPRLPSITGAAVPAGPVKSARYRAPGFRTATRAASAPGLHVPRRRRPPPPPQPAISPASAPSLQEDGDAISDTEDCYSRSMTLPKVREEYREKLKVYPFLASEITKPKAMPLKQKLSKGKIKKNDEMVSGITHRTENMDLRSDQYDTSDEPLSKNIKSIQENILQNKIADIKDASDVSDNEDLETKNMDLVSHQIDTPDGPFSENIKLIEETIIQNTIIDNKSSSDVLDNKVLETENMDLKSDLTATSDEPLSENIKLIEENIIQNTIIEVLDKENVDLTSDQTATLDEPLSENIKLNEENIIQNTIIEVLDKENVDLTSDQTATPDETLSKNIKLNEENIIQNTIIEVLDKENVDLTSVQTATLDGPLSENIKLNEENIIQNTIIEVLDKENVVLTSDQTATSDEPLRENIKPIEENIIQNTIIEVLDKDNMDLISDQTATPDEPLSKNIKLNEENIIPNTIIEVLDKDNMDLISDQNATPDEPLSENIEPIEENIIQNTIMDNKSYFDVSDNKVLDKENMDLTSDQTATSDEPLRENIKPIEENIIQNTIIEVLDKDNMDLISDQTATPDEPLSENIKLNEENIIPNTIIEVLDKDNMDLISDQNATPDEPLSENIEPIEENIIQNTIIEVLDKENVDLTSDQTATLDKTLSKNTKPIQENVIQSTITDNKSANDVSNYKLTDIQNAEQPASNDDIIHTENTTLNIPSTSDTSNIIQKNANYEHELRNTSKATGLELSLTQKVLTPKELSNEIPQLEKEITSTSLNTNLVLLKNESSISSDSATDQKTTTIDSNYSTENMKDSNLSLEVHCENSKTNTVSKLPILKQNFKSRYSPLLKLKRSLSTSNTSASHNCIDKTDKFFSEAVPKIHRKPYKEMSPKEEKTKIETKPSSPLSKKKIETKKNILPPNQNKPVTKSSNAQISPINKEKGLGLSKISTITSKSLKSVTPTILRKKLQRESISSPQSTTLKSNTTTPTEKKSILKRESVDLSTDTKSKNLTDSSYSENTEDINLSQKYTKSDIGTKLPVLKQNINTKYSPLNKLKNPINKNTVVNKVTTDSKDISIIETEQDRENKPKVTTIPKEASEIRDFSDNNYSLSNIQLITSTPKNNAIIDKPHEASDITYTPSLNNAKSFYSLSESIAEEENDVDAFKNTDNSKITTITDNKSAEKEFNLAGSSDKQLSKSRSISTEALKKFGLSRIRRSTLSMDTRSLKLEDEMYISEESQGHATLPRRSNSPLPHEREHNRERFPLNRSGLQTRSESMASVYSGAGEGVRGGVQVRGEVQFSLVYNYRLGALEVGVKRCRDLAPIDVKKNRSDPYVKVYLLPDKSKTGKRKTKVKKNTLNPVFEETLSFQSSLESLSTRALWLSAWHADMFGRNDFLGEVTLPLAGRVFDDPAPSWHALGERSERPEEASGSRGDLIVGLKFELEPRATTGTLHVLVKEARRLVPSRPGALADVFCKSYLLPERGRLHKQKTPVCRRTLAPSWRAGLQYTRLAPASLGERALELTLWDRDRLASNEFLGAVRLSRGTGMYRGESVNWMDSTGKEVSLWETMLQQPNFWVEGSLPLRPHLNN